jgi:predicted nucleotide-binding protein
MPRLSRQYPRTIFSAEIIQDGLTILDRIDQERFQQLTAEEQEERKKWRPGSESYLMTQKDETWQFDSAEEFFAEYRKGFSRARLEKKLNFCRLELSTFNSYDISTTVESDAKTRPEVLAILEIFNRNSKEAYIEEPAQPVKPRIVFIGHGRNAQWRDLKDHLHDKHGLTVEAYEVGARAGHHIRDILDDMLMKSSFGILVMTAEDETAEGAFNPRLNVVHELGLFQGRLGFSRAIILLEQGTAEFSNIYGIQQIRFSKGNIKETFGDVLATIKREFADS